MDFLSVKTLEGRKRKKKKKQKRVTSHIVIYGQVYGGGGGEARKMEAEGEIIAQRHKSQQKYSRAAEEKRISKAR